MTESSESFPMGVVVERRSLNSPWKDYEWRPVAVIPGAGARDPQAEWLKIGEGEGWVRFHAGTLPLELFRKETEGYRLNLSQDPPRLFVVLRPTEDEDSRHEVVPFMVTACPYQAQDYLDSGEEVVEPVAMPDAVVALVQDFVDRYHVDEPFHKRKRKRYDPNKVGFGSRGPVN